MIKETYVPMFERHQDIKAKKEKEGDFIITVHAEILSIILVLGKEKL